MTRTIQCCSDQSESTLQDCFEHADWEMFRAASENNIYLYADSVREFKQKHIGDVVPTVTIKTYPNQKPCIDSSICAKLKVRTTAFNHCKVTGNMAEYKVQLFPHQGNQTGKMPVQRQSGVAIQRLRYETFVTGSTGNQTTKGKQATSQTPTSCFWTSIYLLRLL